MRYNWQVSFLLTNLDDSRPQVKLGVLKDLNFLGEKGGHLWEQAHISVLIHSIMNHYSDRMGTDDYNRLDSDIIYTTLDVINSLTSSSAILNFVTSSGNYTYFLATCHLLHVYEMNLIWVSYITFLFIVIYRNAALEIAGHKYSVVRH